MTGKLEIAAGALAGGFVVFLGFSAVNSFVLLPLARQDGRDRLIAEQAVQSQKEELERKGDDAKLQRMSDYDLCVAYIGRVPECESLRLQPVCESEPDASGGSCADPG